MRRGMPSRPAESRELAPVPADAASSPLASRERRSAPRLETPQRAVYSVNSISYPVEVRNVSTAGAAIHIRQGLAPPVGALVTLSFVNNTTLEGRIVWSDGNTSGMQFSVNQEPDWDLLHFDEMGANYYSAVLKLQSATA